RDSDGQLWLYAGRGDATFAKGVRIPGGYGRYDVIAGAGDLSHDGNADLLVRDRRSGDSYVLPGTGRGTFSHPLGPISRFAGASEVALGQVSRSRGLDVGALDGGRVEAWINSGGFNLGRPIDTRADLSGANRILVAGD